MSTNCDLCRNSEKVGHSMYCPLNVANDPDRLRQKLDAVYSAILPILTKEKEGHIDEDDASFVEAWWQYFFVTNEFNSVPDSYLVETYERLTVETLDRIQQAAG